MHNLRIFGLGASLPFANQIASCLYKTTGFTTADKHHEERRPDGEAYTVSQTNVRGCDVYVVASLYGDEEECVDQKFMKAAIFINALRHASAERITLIAPYLCYARQDRKTESRAPIATQAVAMMLEAVGIDRLLTMDVHNQGAEQNAFRVPIDILEARKPLADTIAKDLAKQEDLCLLSPDAGGVSRTKAMQQSLSRRLMRDIDIVYADKTRIDASNVEVRIVGDVAKKWVVVVDDMISTGGTIQEIEIAVREANGVLWGVAATHGLFVDGAETKLKSIPRIYVTDTIPPFRLAENRVRVVSTTRMFAEAIRRIHTEGGSISQLLED